jgi:hypothetical protein
MIFFCVTLLNIQLFSSRCKYIGKNLLVQAFASSCRAPTPPRVTWERSQIICMMRMSCSRTPAVCIPLHFYLVPQFHVGSRYCYVRARIPRIQVCLPSPFDLWSSAAQCATSYQMALSHGGHTIDSLKSMRPACASDSGAHSHKLLFVCKLVQV